MKRILLVLLFVPGLLIGQNFRLPQQDVSVYDAFIYINELDSGESVFNFTANKDIILDAPLIISDIFRIDSVAGYPRIKFNKYGYIGKVPILIDSFTIDYSNPRWVSDNTGVYWDTNVVNNDPLLYKKFKNEFIAIDSSQTVKIVNDFFWSYYK